MMKNNEFLLPARFWQLVAFIGAIVLVWAGFKPDPVPQYTPNFDKWLHAFAFAGLTVSLLYGFSRLHVSLVLVCMFSLGVAVELGQKWLLPRRSFDIGDIAADTIGICAALMLFFCVQIYKRRSIAHS